MLFREIIKMALASLGANKLRSALTMIGITIGVFSVISVMTAIGALQSSIESGISFLGSNIFQFAKYPANVNVGGEIKKKYQNRRNITYREALHYAKLMEGHAREICLKSFRLRGERTGGLQRREDDAESSHRRDQPKLSRRQRLHPRLRPQSERRRRRAFAPGDRRRQNDRKTVIPARNADRQSDQSKRPHLHDRRRACGERNIFRPEPGRSLHHADHALLRGFR